MPRRRWDDIIDFEKIPESELGRYNYRETRRVAVELEEHMELCERRFDRIERGIWGYVNDDSMQSVDGLLQTVADMKTSAERAAKSAERAAELQEKSRLRVRQTFFVGLGVLGMTVLNGILPAWGHALGDALKIVFTVHT
jgi:hypothetical protein